MDRSAPLATGGAFGTGGFVTGRGEFDSESMFGWASIDLASV